VRKGELWKKDMGQSEVLLGKWDKIWIGDVLKEHIENLRNILKTDENTLGT
jgi:hypothetical protein